MKHNKTDKPIVVFLFKAPKEDGKDRYQEILQEEQVTSVVIPVLSFHYVNQDILRSSLIHSECYGGIILTSVRAVDAVVDAVRNTDQVTLDRLSSLPCFVVGHATQDAAENAGFNPQGGHSGNAQALAQFILENLKDPKKPLLFPCSSIRRENLPDILSSKGLELKEVVSYETSAHENLAETLKSSLLAKGAPHFVVFFSPSGFRYVYDIKDDIPFSLEDTNILALGPATCQCIQNMGLTPHGTADNPDPESVLQLIKEKNSTT